MSGSIPADAFMGAGPATGVSTFLQKLLAMVEDHSCDHLISWTPEGTSFKVHDPVQFAKEVLPKFFKHNNFSSFVRQLNMYDFHKVIRDPQPPSRGSDTRASQSSQEWEFANPKFKRGQLQLLTQVKRKAGSTESAKPKSESIKRVLSEVQAIQEQQMVVSEKLENLETDNKILWGEMTRLRDRHQLQQQTINRILYFLTSIYAPDRLAVGEQKRGMLTGEDDTVTIDAGAASYLNNADDLGALGGGAAGMFAPNIADMLGASSNPNMDLFGGAMGSAGMAQGMMGQDLGEQDAFGLNAYGNVDYGLGIQNFGQTPTSLNYQQR